MEGNVARPLVPSLSAFAAGVPYPRTSPSPSPPSPLPPNPLLLSQCAFWKHDKASVDLGIVWFAVWLHFVVLLIYIPIILLGTRFYSHSAHTLLLISFILSVIVANATRALTKAGLTGTLQKSAKTIFGSVICICVLAGTKLITMTGEIEAVISGSAPRAPAAVPAAKAEAETNPTAEV